MRFTKLVLENFRGFKGRHAVPLHPELTVLVGINGAGKSSALDAAASVMSGMVSRIGGATLSWFGGGDTGNISSGEDSAQWILHLSDDEAGIQDDIALIATLSDKVAKRHASRVETAKFTLLDTLRDRQADLDQPLPYLGYIHSSSTRPPALHKSKVNLTGRLAAYQGAFDAESIQFDALSDWFEQEENLENQEKIRARQLGRELPSLRAVRTAVRRFLSELRGAKLEDLTVIRSHGPDPLAPPKGRLAIGKGGHPLFIEQLSDGERRLILLVADTARRMVILNQRMKDALETDGALLLDEVELHLHPQWQRTVIRALRAAFPRLQFVIATHAPAVLATVPNACVVVLDEGRVLEGTPQVFGRDPNNILTHVMDTPLRPDGVQKELDALFSELDRSPRKAKATLKRLEETLGADDPDLVRARALMQFLAG